MHYIITLLSFVSLFLVACDSSTKPEPAVVEVDSETSISEQSVGGGLKQETLHRQDRVVVRDLKGLPKRTYTVDVSATELMESDEAFDTLAAPLKLDIQRDLLAYEISGIEARKQILGVQMNIAILQGHYDRARELIDRIRALQSTESKAMLTGLVMESLIDAWEVAGRDNAASEDLFERNLRERLSGMPWDVVGDDVLARRRSAEQLNPAVFEGIISTGLDPMLQQSGGEMSYEVARQLVTFRSILVLQLPLQGRAHIVYDEVAAQNGADSGG
jgi:hypothetical protein